MTERIWIEVDRGRGYEPYPCDEDGHVHTDGYPHSDYGNLINRVTRLSDISGDIFRLVTKHEMFSTIGFKKRNAV